MKMFVLISEDLLEFAASSELDLLLFAERRLRSYKTNGLLDWASLILTIFTFFLLEHLICWLLYKKCLHRVPSSLRFNHLHASSSHVILTLGCISPSRRAIRIISALCLW